MVRLPVASVEASVGRRLRSHDLRHPHTAMFIARGEDPELISSTRGTRRFRSLWTCTGTCSKAPMRLPPSASAPSSCRSSRIPRGRSTARTLPGSPARRRQARRNPCRSKGFSGCLSGGAEGIRTPDPLTARRTQGVSLTCGYARKHPLTGGSVAQQFSLLPADFCSLADSPRTLV